MHVELTSRCTLSCPACSRTVFAEKSRRPFPKYDLNIPNLLQFMDCDSGKKIDHFLLSGNHGDPIYYPALFDFIDAFRDNKKFKISTNGSYQSKTFWRELSSRLTSQDTIYFSIDGLEDTNHFYRVNSDWSSIMEGIDIMKRGPARVIWKSITFRFNESQIQQMQSLAQQKKIEFFNGHTSRFGRKEFRPTSETKIDQDRIYENIKHINVDIDPQCNSFEYIAADGYYWPCCWISNYEIFFSTLLKNERENWSIKNQNLDEARQKLQLWKQKIIDDPESAHTSCKMHCKRGQSTKNAWSLI